MGRKDEGEGGERETEGKREGERPSIREQRQVGRRVPRSLVCIPSQSSLMPFSSLPRPHTAWGAEVFIGDSDRLEGQGAFH